MQLYAMVRTLRAVVAVGATGHPETAVAAEVASVVPLWWHAQRTVGGLLLLAYAGELAGIALAVLERPMRDRLRREAALLLLIVLAGALRG